MFEELMMLFLFGYKLAEVEKLAFQAVLVVNGGLAAWAVAVEVHAGGVGYARVVSDEKIQVILAKSFSIRNFCLISFPNFFSSTLFYLRSLVSSTLFLRSQALVSTISQLSLLEALLRLFLFSPKYSTDQVINFLFCS